MQADRSADPARLAGTVRGLGVCDVLRIELAPCQHAALQAELAAQAVALDRELRAAQAPTGPRPAGEVVDDCADARVPGSSRGDATDYAEARVPGPSRGDATDYAALRAEARALAQVRASVPTRPTGPFVLTAPAGDALGLVSACLRKAVVALAAALSDGGAHPAASTAELEAAAAWIATALDCRAVERFCLLPGVDPAWGLERTA